MALDSSEQAQGVAIVRPDWFHRAVETCQALVSRIVTAETKLSRRIVQAFLRGLPSPSTPAETLVLRWLLTELAIHLAAVLHARFPKQCERSCCLADVTAILSKPTDRLVDPRLAFRECMRTLLPVGSRSAAERLARQVKQFVEQHYREKTTTREISKMLGQASPCVTDSFRRTFGMSVHEYLRRVRVQHAVHLLLETNLKVEAVALMVGYRSKKDLYHAIRELVGLTPAQLRRHPFAATLDLLRSELRLLPPGTAAGAH